MSNDTNTALLERAYSMMEYWTGTVWEEVIQADIDSNDLETLHHHVTLADAEAAQQEFYANDAF